MWSVKTTPRMPIPETLSNHTRPFPYHEESRVRTLADLSAGQCAQILCLRCPHAASCERLMAYGLTQGQSVFLLQKNPAFVIRVDETELALDEYVARCIQIMPSGNSDTRT
jgi:Fe2+ transport system protein FeoA